MKKTTATTTLVRTAGKRKLRVGVIGGGHLGTIHARLLRSIDDVELVGVVDPVAAARQRIAAEQHAAVFEHHRQLLGQIDAAIVAVPTCHHYWIGMELAEAGVHLFVEKPLATATAEADALIRATTARNLVLQVGHVERFNPAFTAATAQVARPRYIEAVRASGFTGRATDVGVVLDLMIHDIDLVLQLAGCDVVDVQAIGGAVFGPHEDMAQARLEFASGCVANLSAARTSFQPQREMRLFAADAFVGIDFTQSSLRIVRPSARVRARDIDVQNLSAEERQRLQENLFTEFLPLEEIRVEKRNAILDEQHDFVISIRSGQSPQVTGQHGRAAMAVAETILDKIAQRQRLFQRAAHLPGPHWSLAGDRPPLPASRAG